jgi:hypothetical protein
VSNDAEIRGACVVKHSGGSERVSRAGLDDPAKVALGKVSMREFAITVLFA